MATTLRLTKTVTGGTAIPTAWTLSANGPTPISGNGDTGVHAVTAGTYELSETGGPFGYVPSAWNCGGAIMPSPTSVIVNDSGSPNVIALQVPADPTYRALLSGGRSYFPVGAYLYQVMFNSAGKLGMFKRAASSIGSAWTLTDPGGAPGNLSGNGKATVKGTTISVAYLETGNLNMRIVSFDTTTGLWDTPTVTVTVESPLSTFAFGQQSGGTFVVIAGGVNHFYYITNTGGAWTGPTNMILNPTRVIDGVMDSADAMHVLMNSVSAGIEYRRIPSSFVFGLPTGIANAITFVTPNYPSIILWGAASVAIGVVDNGGTDQRKAQVWIGTPLAAAGFTTYIIATPVSGSDAFTCLCPAQGTGAELNLFYVDADSATSVNQVKQSVFDGVSAWGAPTTFYDAALHPPAFGAAPANQVISGLTPVENGSPWTAAATMRTLQPSQINTGEMLESVTPTGSVVCTITNTFGNTPFPQACIIYDNDPGGTPTFVAYDEPVELQGS